MVHPYTVGIRFLCLSLVSPADLSLAIPYCHSITSVTDRLTIAEIYHAVDDQCHMTFDYLAMCATAGMICGVGLLDDNVVLVVASMLGTQWYSVGTHTTGVIG